MHKSQLAGIIIDCQTDEIDQAAAFWSAATGLTAITDPRSDISKYRRLESLGARRISNIHSWVVLEAPTGQRFCLVNPQRANFNQTANRWE